MNFRLLFSATLCMLLAGMFMSAAPFSANEPQSKESFFDQIATQPVAHFTLTFDLEQMETLKKKDVYFPATFSHNGDNWDAKIKVRGRYRRRICDFPPLKIKMSKDMLEAAGLQRHNKFKLVTHCSDDFNNRDNVLREQLAYDLYHLITGEGYRTQLVKVTYKDSRTGVSIERFGILIEDTDEMAQSMDGEKCDNCIRVPLTSFVDNNLEQVSLFQYMIGNTDWNIEMPRNIKIVKGQNNGQHRAVPYDFDFSGLVNTEYAVPNPNYKQINIQDRIWIWNYDTSPNLSNTIDLFLSKEMEIMAYVNHHDQLSNKNKRKVSSYLSAFFEEIRSGAFPLAQ